MKWPWERNEAEIRQAEKETEYTRARLTQAIRELTVALDKVAQKMEEAKHT